MDILPGRRFLRRMLMPRRPTLVALASSLTASTYGDGQSIGDAINHFGKIVVSIRYHQTRLPIELDHNPACLVQTRFARPVFVGKKDQNPLAAVRQSLDIRLQSLFNPSLERSGERDSMRMDGNQHDAFLQRE
jgi:hypothetical protein